MDCGSLPAVSGSYRLVKAGPSKGKRNDMYSLEGGMLCCVCHTGFLCLEVKNVWNDKIDVRNFCV